MKWIKRQFKENERFRQALALLVGVGLGHVGVPVEVARAAAALLGVIVI